jgi:predicted  nucleic acid-binding Zn-ribbon protein
MPRKTIAVLEKELRGERAKSAELARLLRETRKTSAAGVDEFGAENERLREENGWLRERCTSLELRNIEKASQIEDLDGQNREYERRLAEQAKELEGLRSVIDGYQRGAVRLHKEAADAASRMCKLIAELDTQTKRADGLESMWRAEARKVEAFVAVARALEGSDERA